MDVFSSNPMFLGVKLPAVPVNELDSLEKRFFTLEKNALQFLKKCLDYEPSTRDDSTALLNSNYFEGFENWFKPEFEEALKQGSIYYYYIQKTHFFLNIFFLFLSSIDDEDFKMQLLRKPHQSNKSSRDNKKILKNKQRLSIDNTLCEEEEKVSIINEESKYSESKYNNEESYNKSKKVKDEKISKKNSLFTYLQITKKL